MTDQIVQDFYHDEFAHCYGCGRLNKDGLHIQSHWDGDESICRYTPKPFYTGGFPGYVYGGFIASLIDCHGAATASAAKLRDEGFSLDDHPLSRFVSASIKVDYLKPTPMGPILELRGRVKEIKGRKVTVVVTLSAEGEIRAKGEVTMVQLPENRK